MTRNEEILEALKKLVAQDPVIVPAVVKSVDKDNATCDVVDLEGNEIYDIRLRAATDNNTKGFVLLPLPESTVLLARIGYSDAHWAVFLFSLIDEIVYDNGENGGLIKIEELESRLNNLVGEVNALKDKYNAHTHVTTGTVGATAQPGVLSPTTSQATAASSFNKEDFENTKFTH